MIDVNITGNDSGKRLDRFLRQYLKEAPLSLVYRMIRRDVKLNGRRAPGDVVLREGDIVSLYIDESRLASLIGERDHPAAERQFAIAYEDENLLVVDKPHGLLVHGDVGERTNTLVNQVIDYLIKTGSYVPERERTFVPAPVHRLDRNTAGLVMFGKNAPALRTLSEALRNGWIRRYYTAIVTGRLDGEHRLTGTLHRDEDRKQSFVSGETARDGRLIETVVRPLHAEDRYSLVCVELITGRTHQIRAHLQAAGHAIAGDPKYGVPSINRTLKDAADWSFQLLHASRIVVERVSAPLDYLEDRTFQSELPAQWKPVQKLLFNKES